MSVFGQGGWVDIRALNTRQLHELNSRIQDILHDIEAMEADIYSGATPFYETAEQLTVIRSRHNQILALQERHRQLQRLV